MLVYARVTPGTPIPHSPSDTELSPEVQEHLANAEASINDEIRAYSERYVIPHNPPPTNNGLRMFADFRRSKKNSRCSENGNRRYTTHGALEVGVMYGNSFHLQITPTDP
jgi:hypothetical protein